MSAGALGRILLALLCLPLLACGKGRAADPVAATQSALGKVRSATIDLTLTGAAGTEPPSGDGAVGFRLRGPFQAPKKDGALPVARLESTRLLGSEQRTSRFVSDGTRAWVVTDGRTVELSDDQLAGLRGTTEGSSNLGGLHLTSWFASRSTRQDGADTVVTGPLDTPAALNDVFGLAGAFGEGPEQRRLEGKDAERVRGLVKESQVELVTGTQDHVLRSLRFDVGFGTSSREASSLIPALRGASLHFELRLSDVGAPVVVSAP